jgi:cobalt/nickel transport system ATP-binding protein
MQAGDSKTTELIFKLQEVCFRYNDVLALDKLSISIKRGQRIAILGANGSGKSTLLRVLGGLYFAQSGAVAADGKQLTEEHFRDEGFSFAFRRRVSLVFQNPDVQLFNPTVFDEVAFGPLQLRWSSAEIQTRVNDTLRLLEIAHLQDRAPHRLSGGEKKRVALASVLVLDPEVLLLDEPTSSLDPRSRSQIIDLIVGWRGSNKTVITTTHELDIVEDIADYCYVLQHGRVVAEGSAAQLLADTELLQATNLLHAHRHRHSSGVVHSHPHTHHEHRH